MSTGAPVDRARVLVVDDQPEILRMMERILGEDYELSIADGIDEGRRLLSGDEFELALCDIEMPGGSGLQLAAELAAVHPRTSVVLVTGLDDPEVAQRGFDLGVHGYLVKPFGRGALRITVINALRRRELELAAAAHARSLEERLQTIVDNAPMPIYAKDRELRYVIVNRATEELAGAEPGSLVGKTSDEIMSPASARLSNEGDLAILAGAPSFERRETLVVGGRERVSLTTKFPLMDEDGRVIAVCGISADVTAQAEADRLRDALSAAQREAIRELRTSRLETVERLVRAVELHDPDTGVHVSRMAVVAATLAQLYGLPEDRVDLIRAAAPMHDVGKIGISAELLGKPGRLTDAEREEMQRHTVIGHSLLAESESELLKLAATIALTHHEYYDGSGYPDGLAGDEIPIEGRIVALADVLDALLSDRSYRPAMTVTEATDLIRSESGTHFDPRLVELLLTNLEDILSARA